MRSLLRRVSTLTDLLLLQKLLHFWVSCWICAKGQDCQVKLLESAGEE